MKKITLLEWAEEIVMNKKLSKLFKWATKQPKYRNVAQSC